MGADMMGGIGNEQAAKFSWFGNAKTNEMSSKKLTEVDFMVLEKETSENHERALVVFNKLVEQLEEAKISKDKKLKAPRTLFTSRAST